MTFLLLFWLSWAPPDTLHLPDLLEAARAHWPSARRIGLTAGLHSLDRADALATRLPEVSLGGLAQYQSDVTEIAVPIPGGSPPSQPIDRYALSLDLRQPLWDGGLSAAQLRIAVARTDMSSAEVELRLDQVERLVEEAFFSAALAGTRVETMRAYRDELETRLRQAEARLRNGSGTQAQADAWRVEWLGAEQRLHDSRVQHRAALNRLALLTGRSWGEEPVLMMPEAAVPEPRPEVRLWEARRAELDARGGQIRATRMPKVSAFGTAAYGKPGLDLFDDTFKPWYVVGIQLQWSVWDRGMARRNRERLEWGRLETDIAEAEARAQWEVEAERWRMEAAQAEAALVRDREILELRGRLAAHMAARLEAGTATETDYLAERQAELRARLDRDLHQWNLLFARHQLARTGTQQP